MSSYVLQMPDRSAVRQSLTPGQQDLSIAATEALGNYRVRAGGEQERLDRGFSVNLPAEMSRLERVDAAEIVEALGSERTRVARTRDEIEVRVGLGRVGRELFPALILAVALVLAAEQLLANRFYGAQSAAARAVGESQLAESMADCGRARRRSATSSAESRRETSDRLSRRSAVADRTATAMSQSAR